MLIPNFCTALLVVVAACGYVSNASEVPKEWQSKIDSYNAFFAESDSGPLDRTGYPKGLYMPLLGNGYISNGKGVRSDTMYISGVFNDETTSPSHRAEIPATLTVSVDSSVPIGCLLDVESGVYHRRGYVNSESHSWYELRWYAHRTLKHLYVMELEVHVVDEKEVTVPITNKVSYQSKDIDFNVPISINADHTSFILCGQTKIPETADSSTTEVCLLSDTVPTEVTVSAAESGKVFTYLTAYATSLDPVPAATVPLYTYTAYNEGKALAKKGLLLSAHSKGWADVWQAGMEITARPDVAQAINASFYAILSSVRDDWAYGLAPGGLTNYYNGHSFWDTETWMYPPLLYFHPTLSRSLLQYRFDRIDGAKRKAQSYSPPWAGMMFPWESAFTGVETCPTFAATGLREDHISGDIALAIWQEYLLHQDTQWLASIGYPMLIGIADFWVSRSVYETDPTTGVETAHIRDIIPPDEYVDHVEDSVYTNYVASLALTFAVKAAGVLNTSEACGQCAAYGKLAEKLVILTDPTLSIHPEYKGYPGNTVKQADVVLLHYPLGMEMSPEYQRGDLDYYSTRTDPHGPAMTWGMHAIDYLDLGDHDQAAKYFNMSFQDNMHAPFHVWTETPDGNAVNFITGAGGFLQTMVNGYGGLRIDSESGWTRLNPQCPESSEFVKFRGVSYLQDAYDIEYACVADENKNSKLSTPKTVSSMTVTLHAKKNVQESKQEPTQRMLQVFHDKNIVYEAVLSTSSAKDMRVIIPVQELCLKYGSQIRFALRA